MEGFLALAHVGGEWGRVDLAWETLYKGEVDKQSGAIFLTLYWLSLLPFPYVLGGKDLGQGS